MSFKLLLFAFLTCIETFGLASLSWAASEPQKLKSSIRH